MNILTNFKDFSLLSRFTKFFSGRKKVDLKPCSSSNRNAPYLIDTAKRAKIHKLLNDLASKDALVNAGKMQFLNFCDVKNYMGSKWVYVEPIIISITLDVIGKYTDATDISFRYSEDEFIIIFAKAPPHEAELKCQLISSEIQRLLFEETEKNEKLKDIKINLSNVAIRASKLTATVDPLKALDENLKQKTQKFIDENCTKHTIATPIKKDIPLSESEQISDDQITFIQNLHFKYLPIEMENNRFKSIFAIVIDSCPNLKERCGDPLTDYFYLLLSLSKSHAALCDMTILDLALLKLEKYPRTSFFISVRYDTLIDNRLFHDYLVKLQKLIEADRKRLFICVYNIPHDIPLNALKRSIMMIKDNCSMLFAIVPHYKNNDCAKLLNSGFKGICFLLLAKDSISPDFSKKIQKFLEETKIYNFKTLALVGERENNLITRQSLAGFKYIGGSIVGKAHNKISDCPENNGY